MPGMRALIPMLISSALCRAPVQRSHEQYMKLASVFGLFLSIFVGGVKAKVRMRGKEARFLLISTCTMLRLRLSDA
jgi:hypothetical protein